MGPSLKRPLAMDDSLPCYPRRPSVPREAFGQLHPATQIHIRSNGDAQSMQSCTELVITFRQMQWVGASLCEA
jgi:hypothetical protein